MDYPINDISFINNKTILVCGGGGESKSGVPNKITAMRCSFKIKDKTRRLQKFREVNLPKNEDSPLCLAVSKNLERNEGPEFSVLVGCNQSQELRSLNVNNNVRKYTFVENNHFTFQDAAQFDEDVLLKPRTEDPKHIQVASDSSVAVMMTTATPSEMVIFNPSMLEPINRISPSIQSEILDLHLCPFDNGQTLTYITSTSVTTIYTNTGAIVPSSTANASKTEKTFSKYLFSKVHYIDASRVLLVGSLKSRKGTVIIEYNIQTGKVLKDKTLFSTSRPVALAYCEANGLVAIALNDFSVSLVKATDFKVVKTYKKLHNFAITCLSFCPNGSKLASGSAAQTLNVIKLDQSSGFLWRLFKLFFWAIFIAIFAVGLQVANQSGSLDTTFDLLRLHGGDAYVHAHKYGKLTYDFSQKYGAEYYEKAQHHGAIYLDVAQRYGKIGFEIAKAKGLEGYSIVLDKVEKWKAEKASSTEYAYSETPEWISSISETTETPTTLTTVMTSSLTTTAPDSFSSSPSSSSSSSAAPTVVSQDGSTFTSVLTNSTTPTLQASSTTNDMMTEVTKKVNTEDTESVDTISLISEAVQQITNVDLLKSMTSEVTEGLGSVYSSAGSVASLLVSDITSTLIEPISTEYNPSVESAILTISEASTVSQPLLTVSSSMLEKTEVVEEITTLTILSTSTTSIDYSSESIPEALSLDTKFISTESTMSQATSSPSVTISSDSSLSLSATPTISAQNSEISAPSVVSSESSPSVVSSATVGETPSSFIDPSSEDQFITETSSKKLDEKKSNGHSASLDFPTENSVEGRKHESKQKEVSETPEDSEPRSTPRAPDNVKPIPETNPKRTPAEPVPESAPSPESSSSSLSSSVVNSSASVELSHEPTLPSTETATVSLTVSSSSTSSIVDVSTIVEALSTTETSSASSLTASAPVDPTTVENFTIETSTLSTRVPESSQATSPSEVSTDLISYKTTETLVTSIRETETLERLDDKSTVTKTVSTTSISTLVVHDEF